MPSTPSGAAPADGQRQLPDAAPLCVDLDGTLTTSDTLAELILNLLRQNPLFVLLMPWWCCRGRVYLKRQLVRRARVRPELLPYQQELLGFIGTERAAGRQVVMVSAAPAAVAREVAQHLGCFDEVIATEDSVNVAGVNKRSILESRFGMRGFDYVGNGGVDLVCLAAARNAFVASPSWRLRRALRNAPFAVTRTFDCRPPAVITLLRAMRPMQWVKNALVFAPIVLAHEMGQWGRVAPALALFAAFNLAASCGYLVNDLLDLEADRQHRYKRMRPFAAGEISPWVGVGAAPVLLLIALGIGLAVSQATALCVAGYVAGAFAYSLYAKRLVVLDALVLAGLYSFRIFSGGIASGIPISQWLTAFSMFFFLSLAFLKRYSELRRVSGPAAVIANRGYAPEDLEQVRLFGIAAGYLSALVLALYVRSSDVVALYRQPQWLWLISLILVYWISRAWLLAGRGAIHEDPLLFAFEDRASYVCGIVTVAVLLLASH